jgi:hypothetical protein
MTKLNLDCQRTAKAQGLNLEAGHLTFQPGQVELKVPTMLKTVFYAHGTLQTESAQWSNPVCTCDNEVVDNKVVFQRLGPYYGRAAVMNYFMAGW